MKRQARAPPGRTPRMGGTLGRALLMVACVLCAAMVGGAAAYAADPTPAGTFDGSTTPDGSFTNGQIAVDEASGDVYVVDPSHDVIDRFSTAGAYVSRIRGSDTSTTTFGFDLFALDEITVDNSGGSRQGWLYVVSTSQNTIYAFDSTGAEQWAVPSAACGLAVDPDGAPWIADRSADLVELNPADGTVTGARITVEATQPCAISFDRTGAVYVTSLFERLEKYTAAGDLQFTLVPPPNVTTDVSATFRRNDVFAVASEAGIHRVRQWDDSSGAVLSSTRAASGLNFFFSVAFDGIRNKVFVSDGGPFGGLNNIQMYTVPPQPPSVAARAPTNTATTSATLNGVVNPNGADITDCHFEYGLTATYGSQVPCSPPAPVRGLDDVPVRANIAGLRAGTTYHYRVVATSSGGTTRGADTLLPTVRQPPPTVTRGAASGITQTGATLNGTVNPQGDATTCRFQYGTTTAYGSEVAMASPGAGSAAVPVNASAAGLTAGTMYHFRLVCSNGGGSTNGADATFRTLDNPPPPDRCVANPASCQPPPARTCATDPTLCRTALALAGGTARVTGSTALIGVNCTGDTGGTCRGSLTLKAKVRYKVKRGRRTVTKTRTITVGTASYSVAVGSRASLRVTLSSAAKSALKKRALTATADGVTGSVKLPKTRAPRRRRAHRRK